jgi:hypothetical protein
MAHDPKFVRGSILLGFFFLIRKNGKPTGTKPRVKFYSLVLESETFETDMDAII